VAKPGQRAMDIEYCLTQHFDEAAAELIDQALQSSPDSSHYRLRAALIRIKARTKAA
jgi:hypothetical protein